MDFTPALIQQYAEAHTTPESKVLKELSEDTKANIPGAQMLSGHLQGQFLSMISEIIRPQLILEIGTYTGYSAICLAAGLQKDGVLHTIDIDDQWQEMVKKYVGRAKLSDKIQQHVGHALEVIPNIEGSFDLVFIDADKKNYPKYYELALSRLKPGGVILVDNTLWSGRVTKEEKDEKTKAIDQLNKTVQEDEKVDNVLLPIRDGVMFIRKK